MAIDYLDTRGLTDFWQAVREYYSESASKKVDEATQADHFAKMMTIVLGGSDGAISGNVSFDGSQDVTLTATISDVTNALHGFMTPEQKIKLDGIEEGGQVNILEGVKVIVSRSTKAEALPIDENKDVTLDLSTYALIRDVNDETDRASAVEATLNTAIDTERRTRESDSIRLQAAITAEEIRATEAEQSLQSTLSGEISNRIAGDTALSNRIDGLNFTEIGEEGKFVATIAQTSGAISSTLAAFIDDLSTTENKSSVIAPQTAAIVSYVDSGISAEANTRLVADTSLAQSIATETQNRVDADTTLQNNIDVEAATRLAADTTLQDNLDTEAATRLAADTSIINTINDLDFTEIGENGKFLYSIRQEDGQISATLSSFISDVSNNATSTTAPQTAAIKTYVDDAISSASSDLDEKLNQEIQDRIDADTSLNTRIDDLDFTEIGENGKFLYSIKQNEGNISATLSSFIDDISTSAGGTSTTAPQSAAVRTYVDSEISSEASTRSAADTTLQNNLNAETTARINADTSLNERIDNLDFTEIGEDGKFVYSIKQEDGQITSTLSSFIADISTAPGSTSTTAPQSKAVKAYVDAETTRASNAEEALSTSINSIIAPTSGIIDTRIAAEAALREAADIDLGEAIDTETQNRINAINALDFSEIGSTGSFLYSIKQEDGQISATLSSFIDDISTTSGSVSTVAPQSIAVKTYVDNAIDSLDVAEVGSDGNFILKIKENDGKITATTASFISDISTTAGGVSTTAPQSAAVRKYVDDTIDSLDVSEVGSDGNFILKIKEDDGKITATTAAFISDISDTPGSISTTAPQAKAVKDYVDAEIEAIDTSITEIIEALDFTEIGEDGKFVYSISQEDGQINSTLSSFISDISTTAGGVSTTAPQSKAVKKYVDDTIDSLDVTEVGSDGNFILKIKEDNGKITATTAAFISDISNTPGSISTTAPQSKAVKDYVDDTINSLDVAEVGSNGNFILKIKEDNGKITATTAAFIADISTTPGATSTTAPQSAAVKTYVDTEIQNLGTSITETIESLDFTEIGEDGKFVYSIKQDDGQISSTLSSFISDISTTPGSISTTAPQSKAVKDYVDDSIAALDVSEVGSDGNFLYKIKEDNGKITATTAAFITNIASSTTSTTAPQTKAVKEYVDDSIAALDVNEVGSDGSFLYKIKETDGKIITTASAFITDISTTPGSVSTTAPQAKAVKAYVDDEIAALDTSITNAINALDFEEIGEAGKFVYSIKQEDGQITSTLSSFITDISTTPGSTSTTAPQAKAVKAYVDNTINSLDVTEVGSDGSFILKIKEDDGKITATTAAFIADISTSPGSVSTTAPQSKAVKKYVDDEIYALDTSLSGAISDEIAARTTADTSLSNRIDERIVGKSSGTTENHIVTWGSDGYHVKDSGYTIQTSVPSGAVFTDTTYSASDGVMLTGTNFTNSGVRSVTASTSAGYIDVNTNGTTAGVHINADIAAGIGISVSTSSTKVITNTGVRSVIPGDPGHILVDTNGTTSDINIAPPLTAGAGINTDDNIITNTGVRVIADSTTNGAIEVNTNGTTTVVTVYEHYSSTASGNYGNSTAQTPSYGTTFNVPYITVNSEGHITAAQNTTVKIPAALTSLPSQYGLTIQTNGTTQVTDWKGSTSASINITYDNVGAASAGHTHNNYSSTVSTTGSGDLVTGASISGNTLTITKNQSTTGIVSDSTALPTAAAVREFVNSSINSMAAFYITKDAEGDAFATKAELDAAAATGTYYSGGHLREVTNNDYCMVLADETHDNATCRYMYTVPEGQTAGSWSFQYIVNTAFTAAQTAALNSGIDSTLTAQITTNANDIATLSSSKADKATTLAGYGITDAKIVNGVITLGSTSITPLTAHPVISTTSSTDTATPGFGSTFSAVSSITKDSNGHITDMVTKTVTIPSSTATSSVNGLMTSGQASKLAGIEANANNYTHPSITASGTTSSATPGFGSTFTALDGVTVNSNGHVTAYNTKTITIPSSPATTAANGLMTTAQVTKLDGIADNANNYTHPSITASGTTSTSAPGFGGTFTAIDSETVNSNGHVTAYNTKTITIPSSTATTTADGLMTTAQVTKLNGIEAQANKYTHPTYAGTSSSTTAGPAFGGTVTAIGTVTLENGHIKSYTEKTITIPSSTATTQANGLMTTAQVTKLNGIADNANNYTHPSITASGTTSSTAPGFGGTFTAIDSETVNSNGHVTAYNTKTITIPSSTATTAANGLMTTAQVTKLEGIEANANKYTHPTYAGTSSGTTAAPAFGGTVAAVGTVTLENGHIKSYTEKTITIPSSTATTQANGLMTTAQVTKLNGIADNANNYTHPTISASGTTSSATPSFGSTFTALDSVTVNSNGHVTAYNTKTITIPASAATTTANGLMTPDQVTKLAGIEANANKYTHPTITASGTTSTTSPGYSGTFTAIDSITVNTNGHVTAYNTKTVTIPASDNTDTYPSGVSVSSVSGTNTPVITVSRAGTTTTSVTGSIPLATTAVNGVISTTTQSFAGDKTFTGSVIVGSAKLTYSTSGTDKILTVSFV